MEQSSKTQEISLKENNESALHNSEKQVSQLDKELSLNPNEEEPYICPYDGCNRQFRRPWRLKDHLCTHKGEIPYKCTVSGCDKAYTSSSHLKRHTLTAHLQEKYEEIYRCPHPECMVQMKNLWNIKKHYKAKHEPKSFSCLECNYSFRKNSQLKAHMYHHTGVPPFVCIECGDGFLRVGDLNRHSRHHKTHICSFDGCSMTFEKWTHLRKHIALEHRKEYVCATCNKTFYHKGLLRQHVSSHLERSERDVMYCSYENCGRFYYEKKNLMYHIRSAHLQKLLTCTFDGCDRQFRHQIL